MRKQDLEVLEYPLDNVICALDSLAVIPAGVQVRGLKAAGLEKGIFKVEDFELPEPVDKEHRGPEADSDGFLAIQRLEEVSCLVNIFQ